MNSLFFNEKFKNVDLSDEPKFIKVDLSGLYKISNRGVVKCADTGTVIKPYINNNGYLCICLKGRSGKEYRAPIHQLVADAFLVNPDKDFYTSINHKDEDKTNADVRNLEWCSTKYNNHYSVQSRCSLSENEIIEISKWLSLIFDVELTEQIKIIYKEMHYPLSVKEIASKYHISINTVYRIRKAEGYYGWVLYKDWFNSDECVSKEILGSDRFNELLEKMFDVHYLDEKVPYMEKW